MKMDKNSWLILDVVFAVAAISILAGIFYLYANTGSTPKSISLPAGTYVRNASSCVSSAALASEGYVSICTTVYNLNAQLNTSNNSITGVPSDFIFTTYKFANSSSLTGFLGALKENLNTTPWPGQTTALYSTDNALYTTIYFPNYNQQGNTAVVIAEYVNLNNVVWSVSTKALMYNSTSLSELERTLNSALLAINKSAG